MIDAGTKVMDRGGNIWTVITVKSKYPGFASHSQTPELECYCVRDKPILNMRNQGWVSSKTIEQFLYWNP